MKSAIIITIFLIILGVGLVSISNLKSENSNNIILNHMEVVRGPFLSTITAPGRIISKRYETVKSNIHGSILDLGYSDKDIVKKGVIIAKIKLNEEEYTLKKQRLELAEIDLQIAREQHEQAQELFRVKAISEKELKELRIREYKQSVEASSIRDELKPKEIRASFDGIIVNKKYQHMNRVFMGTELFTLIDMQFLCIEITVQQRDISKIKMGQKVILSSSILNKSCIGKINEISSTTTHFGSNNFDRSQAATLHVYATFHYSSGDHFLFGADIDTKIIINEAKNKLAVPLEAVIYQNNKKFVYILKDQIIRKRFIKTGGHNDKNIEIVSGLSPGEYVITNGNNEIYDGMKIAIIH